MWNDDTLKDKRSFLFFIATIIKYKHAEESSNDKIITFHYIIFSITI